MKESLERQVYKNKNYLVDNVDDKVNSDRQ